MLSIKFSQGLWKAQNGSNTVQARTLEKLLQRLDPGAPEEKIAAAAEILAGIVGENSGQIHHGVIST